MDEFELVDRYFRRAGAAAPVALGIGDDGAVVDLPAGRQLVCVVDTLVDGVHYPRGMDAADVGYRAVAVNLSDMAAMGGTPCCMTLALTLPAAEADWLEGFARGLFAAADEHGVVLIGGDTTRGRETVISVQLLGHVGRDRYLTRSGCRSGDALYVSGSLGDAAGGLALCRQGEVEDHLLARFRRPAARVALGQAAAAIASAAIDLSDGLCADLGHLLAASGAGAEVDVAALPLSAPLEHRFGRERARQLALSGGDDYELCLSVSPASSAALERAAADCGVALTRIGRAVREPGLKLSDGGRPYALDGGGYRHF